MSAQNRMTMFQGCIMGVLLVCINACLAAVTILGEDKQYFDADKPLLIECELNDSTTDIDFRFNSITVVSCEPQFGCGIKDFAYNVTKTDSSYILHTVNNFNATGCGVYQCTDIESGDSDTVNVTYKKFNIDADNVEEQDLSLTVPTTCVFPSISDNITVTWFGLIENIFQQLDLDSASSFIKTVNETDACSNGTCNAKLAKEKTSFGLNFSETIGQYVYSVIEVRIVHSSFNEQPLKWRSSKQYPVKEIETVPANNSKGDDTYGVFALLFIVVLLFIGIHVYIWRMIRDLTLFSFITNTWNIAWNMWFECKATDGSHFYVLVKGKIVVSLNYSEIKIITPGDAFAKFDLIYGMAETPIQMISEITVKNDTSGATAKIYASSGLRVLQKSDDVRLLKLERKKYNEILMVQKKAEWKYTLYQEMLSKCALFNKFDLQAAQRVASEFEAICFRDGEDILSPIKSTKDIRINGLESQRTGAGDKKTSHGFDCFCKIEPEKPDDEQTSVEGSETSDDVFIIIEGSAVATNSSDINIRVQAEYKKFDYLGNAVSKTIYRSVIAHGPVLCAKHKQYKRNGNQIRIER
ncbi:uncharacterized protein LOC128233510 isoform X2 [Mya arenaria]|uniref:uncharacterized protein LOC128233510 isoform X2 n=1 Tax=Mya arenaria TaxID=6604 RepID=UPI0022E957C4|nr:uncharacterized protein LOC128233510 isoform X2 [Mya arenaria]